jgi:hypothetical protein
MMGIDGAEQGNCACKRSFALSLPRLSPTLPEKKARYARHPILPIAVKTTEV